MIKAPSFSFSDLFARCVGLSLGMERLGFTAIYANEVLMVAACLNHSKNGIMFP